MNKNNKGTKRALWSSNIFSVIGSTTAACCAGPLLAGCAATCGAMCGSTGLSIFGLSASGMSHWIGGYWYIFLILSILCFAEAFYRIFYVNRFETQKKAKILFFSSLILSILLFAKIYF